MTRDEWIRIKAIASEALTRPSSDRAAWVAARCGEDVHLAGEVQSLLASISTAEPLYESAPYSSEALEAALAEADLGERAIIGERIGAYRILRELGRGGMGTAYLAERADESYEKQVAIKLIKRGMDSDAILRRFRDERQILADLEHPHIVRLLDGGSTRDGRPYFVMEFVDGLAITTYCRTHDLDVASRLRLFQAVCAAVQHAHDRRVVHRDLKPGNILVTSAGVPKLLDFGIARVLDPDAASGEPTLIGRAMTPDYASPEQVRGEVVTPASDVHALGILLYQLLTDRHPYRTDGRTIREIERAICEDLPPRPSVLAPSLPQPLDAVVLKALQKSPDARYPSAQALSDEIERYLEGRPVQARLRLAHWAPRQRLAAAGALAVVLLVAAWLATARPWTRSANDRPRTVAVLPFTNDSGRADLEYLSDGVAEDIINRLSRTSQLKVIARDTTYRYKNVVVDPRQVGQDLGVEAVLTGRVAQSGERLSVSSELIDARDGSRLWGDKYEQGIGDLSAVQRDLATQIAANLRLQFSEDDRARFHQAHTSSPEAYHAYLRGRYFWNKRTAAGMRRSAEYFQDALRLDPAFAAAYAGLADSFGLLTEYHSLPAAQTYSGALAAVSKALETDAGLAEAHISRAYVHHFYEWNPQAAEREFILGLQLNPNYATGHQWYAEFLSAMGRHDEALQRIRMAQDLDPLSLIVNSIEAYLLYIAGRNDEAIAKSRQVVEMDPNFPEVYEYLKRAYDQKGAYRDAIAARQTRRRLLGRDVADSAPLRAAVSATSARAYWQSRRAQEALEAAAEGVLPFEMAEILAQGGETTAALDWLERACRDHDFMMLYVRVMPTLQSLRGEQRYRDIVTRGCAIQD